MSLVLTAFGMPVATMAHVRAAKALKNNEKMSAGLVNDLKQAIVNEQAVHDAIRNHVVGRLTPVAQNTYDTLIDYYKSQGMDDQKADQKSV